MSCLGELEKPDAVIFADTQWESKATYQWLGYLMSQGAKHGLHTIIVSKGNIKEDALISQVRGRKINGRRWASMPYFTIDRETGEWGMIRRQCTSEYKIYPIEKKQRELLGYKPRQRIPIGAMETWKGISVDESRRANLSRTRWVTFYYPLIEMGMSREDCTKWFKKHNIPCPPRSSCLGCPFHSDREWLDIKSNKEEWADVVLFDKAIRKCGGMKGDLFLHAQRKPLDEVKLKHENQKTLFDNECAGVCGV
jgi:hypothetical protein